MKEYKPNPIDTSKVSLPEELESLLEIIAEKIHDKWAANRISQGWTYGPCRNDTLKQTPCLVPYNELSEEEKEYDRSSALETLQMVISLGYKITKNNGG